MRPSVRFAKLETSGWMPRVGLTFGPICWAITNIDFYGKSIEIETRSMDTRPSMMPGTWGVSRYGFGNEIACIKTPAQIIDEATTLGKFVGVTISKDSHLAMWQAVPLIVSPRPNQNAFKTQAIELGWLYDEEGSPIPNKKSLRECLAVGWQCWTVQDGPENSGRIDFHRHAGIKKRIDYPVCLSAGGHVMIPLRWVRDTIMTDENLGRIADPLDGVRPSHDDRQLKLKGRW